MLQAAHVANVVGLSLNTLSAFLRGLPLLRQPPLYRLGTPHDTVLQMALYVLHSELHYFYTAIRFCTWHHNLCSALKFLFLLMFNHTHSLELKLTGIMQNSPAYSQLIFNTFITQTQKCNLKVVLGQHESLALAQEVHSLYSSQSMEDESNLCRDVEGDLYVGRAWPTQV